MKWFAVAALLSFALVMGCIIIPDPPEIIPPPPPPPEVGGVVPVPFPVLGGEGMRIAELWFVRTDPGTSTLTSSYTQMIAQAKASFEASGASIESVAVFALQDGSPLWASKANDGGASTVPLEDALRYYAAHPWDAGFAQCPTLIPPRVASNLAEVKVVYPEELVPFVEPAPIHILIPLEDGGVEDGGFVDGGDPFPVSTFPFRPGFNAVFVAIVDSGPRVASYLSFECAIAGDPAAVYLGAGNPLAWIHNNEVSFQPAQVAWALIGTSEDAGSSAMKAACQRFPSFPRPALDVISASSVPLYTPWARHAVDFPSVVNSYDFCEAAAGEWHFGVFVNNWANRLTEVTVPK